MRNRNRTGEEKLWATLAHLAIVPVVTINGLGLLVTILIFYFKRRRSPWMAFQGLQALAFQAIAFTFFAPLRFFLKDSGESDSMSSPLFWVQVLLILVFFYAVMGATRCALGYNFRYPLIGRPIQQRFRVQEE